MAKYDWYEGRVVDIIDETPTVKRFFIEVPDVENFKYVPGQFVILEAVINSQVVRREYSIASAPDDSNVFELLIVIAEHGLFTTWLFSEIKVGSTIKTSSALGKFVLPPNLDEDLCFICTGVGLAPFRSMIVDIYRKNIPHKNIDLVFGTRYMNDLCYPEELYSLEKKESTFHFFPSLSREKSEEWKGHKGYIHDIYKDLYKDKRPAYFYICGWKNMIFQARDNLTELGYDKKHIRFELFD